MSGSGNPGRDLVDEGVVLLGRDAREVVAEDDRPQVRLERLAGLEPPRFVGQPALDVDVAGGVEPAHGRERRLEMDVAQPAVADPRRGRAGPRRCCRPRRTGRRACRRVGSRRRGSGRARRGRAPNGRSRSRGPRRRGPRSAAALPRSATTYSTRSPKRASRSRHRLDHRRRPVERDHRAVGQALGQHLGHAAAAAAGVEDAFVAVERQALQDGRAPVRHRRGDPVVGPGVPVARHRVGQAAPDGGSVAPAAGTDAVAADARPGSRSPYHDTNAPTDEQPGADPHRQLEGRRSTPRSRRRPAAAVAPAPAG